MKDTFNYNNLTTDFVLLQVMDLIQRNQFIEITEEIKKLDMLTKLN